MRGSIFPILVVVLAFSCTIGRKGRVVSDNNTLDIPPYTLVQIAESDYKRLGPCEPSICISPLDNDVLLVGSILDRVHRSGDGGKTWSQTTLKSPYGVYGDPAVKIDKEGVMYYAHLSNPEGKAYKSASFLDRIVVQKSMDGGKTWNKGSYPPGDLSKDQDKQWLYIDPKDGTLVMTWTEFDVYGSKDKDHKSRIMFSKSTDKAESWTPPVMVSMKEGYCEDNSKTTEGALPIITSDGTIHVAWSYKDSVYMNSSYDRGITWQKRDMAVAPQKGGWAYAIPGLGRCNGMPVLLVDISESIHRGNMYINYADISQGKDDSNVWFVRSTNGGRTWSERINVHQGNTKKHQFLTWMDVDPKTGYIYIIYYDRSQYDDTQTDVMLAYSTDGGRTFKNERITQKPFTPVESVFFGDYNNICAYDGRIRPVWTEYAEGKLSIWTALIDIHTPKN